MALSIKRLILQYINPNNIIMITYCILSAIFFVLYILFQGLQSIGEKLNDITSTYENKKPEDENSFAQRCKRQIEYEKTLIPDSEELRKVREDFKKAYWEERESVRLKMCEGYYKSKKAIAYSPEYYAGREQYKNNSDLFMSMERDFVEYTKRRP